MEYHALRTLVLASTWATFGVAATVRVPDGDPVSCRVIWVTPPTDAAPTGAEFQRRDQRRSVAIRRADVPAVPRGTVIEAVEKDGDAARTWVVDGTLVVEAEHVRVTVVPYRPE